MATLVGDFLGAAGHNFTTSSDWTKALAAVEAHDKANGTYSSVSTLVDAPLPDSLLNMDKNRGLLRIEVGDSRKFRDGSVFVIERLAEPGWRYRFYEIVRPDGTKVLPLWRGTAARILTLHDSAEPGCLCSVRDLSSGPHPPSCAWLQWKVKNRGARQ